MIEPKVDLDLALAHGLTEEEYELVLRILGRTPTYPELGVFSVMWAEHCPTSRAARTCARCPPRGPR